MDERTLATIEELSEVESLAELKALQEFGGSYSDPFFIPYFRAAERRLKEATGNATADQKMLQIAALEAQLAALRVSLETGEPLPVEAHAVAPAPVTAQPAPAPAIKLPVVGAAQNKRYRLIKTDVSWSKTPQVIAIMDILMAHMAIGEARDESDIVRMMEANTSVLSHTVQGGKKIWDYYKGNHARGLVAHGNLEQC